jgi:hypothetical protein
MAHTICNRFRVLTSVLIACGAFSFSGCGGRPVAPPEAEGKRAAEPFLAAIREDRLDAAWDSTTAEFKSDMGRETFHRFAKSHPVLGEPLTYVGYKADTTNGIERGACDFHSPAAGAPKIRILVAQEEKVWKVERLIVE